MTVILKGDTAPPTNYPLNIGAGLDCSLSLPECFGDLVMLKDFSDNGENNPIAIEEFEEFSDKVAEDLHSHDIDWPGNVAGRYEYDTPFYNNGTSWRNTDDPQLQAGYYPAAQQVCIETIRCSGRSEINYIAQGMWGAATGEPKPISNSIVWTWKIWEYQEAPSDDTLFWLNYGYDYYLEWLDEQNTQQ
jgi:hypothetical protein